MYTDDFQSCLRHSECTAARENRDTVFCQMRRAMDLIHYVVKDGVLSCADPSVPSVQREELGDNDRATVYACMKRLQRLLEHSKISMGRFSSNLISQFHIFCIRYR